MSSEVNVFVSSGAEGRGIMIVVVSAAVVGDNFGRSKGEVVPLTTRGVLLTFVLSGKMDWYRSNCGGNW